MSSFTNGALDSSPIALPKITKPKANLDDVATRCSAGGGLKRKAEIALPTPPRARNEKRMKTSKETRRGDDADEDVFGDVFSDRRRKLDLPKSSTVVPTAPMTPSASFRQPRHKSLPPSPGTDEDSEDPLDNPFIETPPGMTRPPMKPPSPDTPFPDLPPDDDDGRAGLLGLLREQLEERDARGERKFVQYVFKGKRATFVNPHFNAAPSWKESLPIWHPEYEPPRRLKPQNLFPKATAAAKARRVTKSMSPELQGLRLGEDNPFVVGGSTKRKAGPVRS